MFQNAFQMFCNDFEMVFNEYFVSLKCIVNVPKRVDNVFKMHSQRLKMHCQWKMVQRSFPLRVVFANRVTIKRKLGPTLDQSMFPSLFTF